MKKEKLFVISSRIPFPLEKGDKLRLYHQLRFLNQHFEICLCSVDETGEGEKYLDDLKEVVPNTHIIPLSKFQIYLNVFLGLLGRKPLQVHYFFQRKARKKVKEIIEGFQPDHIYCQLIRASEYVKDFHDIPKTIDYMDAFSKGVERRIDRQKLWKGIFRSEHRRLLKYENLMFDYFDHHTIISEEDRNYIFHEDREQIKIVPNGIDTERFTPKVNAKKEYDFLFVGNMSYAPNVDSAKYIVEKIMPLVWKEHPTAKLLIAGANPGNDVKKLAGEQVKISGWVEDIRDSYASAKVFLAPMQIGSGLQNKLLEAMAMELPCVTSPLANRSLKANPDQAIVCETPEQYVKALLELLNTPDEAKRIAINGRKFVENNFSWERAVNDLAALIKSN